MKQILEANICPSEFAYRDSCSCIDAMITMQYNTLKSRDEKDNRCVRLFTMDFSKAFDNVKHSLLSQKLKSIRT